MILWEETDENKKKYYHIPDATTEQMGYGSISFFVFFPLMNQIVITYPFCQIKKVAEFLPFFAAIYTYYMEEILLPCLTSEKTGKNQE